MKAVQLHAYGDVDQLFYEEVPAPKPGEGEVLVQVAATSINPIDWKLRGGAAKDRMSLPAILGRDVAGVVAVLGTGVARFRIGDRVLGVVMHAYAELLVAKAEDLALIPNRLEDTQAAALPLVGTTGSQLIERAGKVRAGQVVLVTGALGGVGRTAVFVAKEHRARVFAGVRKSQLDEAAQLGADGVVAVDDDASLATLPSLDVIADTVGQEVAARVLPKLKSGGTYASVVGAPEAAKQRDVQIETFMAQPDAARLALLAVDLAHGSLKLPVAKIFRLSEIREAQKLAERGAKGKVVIIP